MHTVFKPGPLRGEISVPGDKSISHRALIAAAAVRASVSITNLNSGRDVLATLRALQACGATIQDGGAEIILTATRLHHPDTTVDCMNSGSTARMFAGVCAGANLSASFDGDQSLKKRPMEPVAAQLRAFGARIDTTDGRLPLRIAGTDAPQTRNFILIAPSAQVKSSLLFAALFAEVDITITGDRGSRDHTERLLRAWGATLKSDASSLAYTHGPLQPTPVKVPGDFSSAAFFIVAATITPGSSLRIADVGINPTRTGLLDALAAMGAHVRLSNQRLWNGEPVADISVESAPLQGATVSADLALRAIDEIPVLAVAAARAHGPTTISGIADLRTKESDRVAAIARILAAVNVPVEAAANGLTIAGGSEGPGAGVVATHGDHRTGMSVAALAAAAGPLGIDDAAGIDVSFPGFADTLVGAQRE